MFAGHGKRHQLAPLQIGRHHIWPPLVQAPMAALTNVATRKLAERHGCGLVFTELVAAGELIAARARALARMRPTGSGQLFAVQIYGRDPATMRAAAAAAVGAGADIVDINMGCPSKQVARGSCGAALMREPELAGELVAAVVEGAAGRAEVTVKIRSGWDAGSKNAPELARRLEQAGAAAVTVHGRTRDQRFSGGVDYAVIGQVKAAVSVPVIANGDIVDVPTLERALSFSGADGAMIGRAAIGDPWIFERLRSWCEGREPPAMPTPKERIATYLEHCRLHLASGGDRGRALREMRTFAERYLDPVDPDRRLRQKIFQLDRFEEIEALVTCV